MKLKKKINYVCHLNNSGWSTSARNYIKILNKKYDITLIPALNPDFSSFKPDQSLFLKLIERSIDKNAPTIYHCVPTRYNSFKRELKGFRIGVGVAEWIKIYHKKDNTFSNIPVPWINNMKDLDHIICPSKHCYELFNGIKNCSIIPHTINFENHKPIRCKYNKILEFLYIATNTDRKNIKQLLRSWKYINQNKAHLTIKTNNIHDLIELNTNNVDFVDKTFTDKDLYEFYQNFDVFISTSLGEGFGMNNFEALSFGLPLISMFCTGCMDYMNDNNAIKIIPEFNKVRYIKEYDDIGLECSWAGVTNDRIISAINSMIENFSNFDKNKISQEILDVYNKDAILDSFDRIIGE